jgi:hypothetical protein
MRRACKPRRKAQTKPVDPVDFSNSQTQKDSIII